MGENSGDTDIKTFTQEFRLSQSLDNIDWMLGAYYFDETVDYDNVVTYDSAMNPYGNILSQGAINDINQLLQATGQLPPGVGFLQAGQGALDFTGQDDKTYSLFGQADWHFTDQWTLTGGLNYTKVKKDAFVNQLNSDVWSSVSMVQLGFAAAFTQLTGLPPTPEKILLPIQVLQPLQRHWPTPVVHRKPGRFATPPWIYRNYNCCRHS
ncbi:MAG: TonB-dependent receptor [Xanthomonadales bacterium]|nr:TonB-dependent receptor [Xanthomonadales bacterium]